MITLKTHTGESITSPTLNRLQSALADVISHPKDERGFTSIALLTDEGWRITAYGCDLVILDKDRGSDYVPSHMADLSEEQVIDILQRFLDEKDNLSDLNWQLGYGPG
jgi:hypothetical protein